MDKKENFKKYIKEKSKTITLAALEYLLSAIGNLAELSLDRKVVYRYLYNFSRESWSDREAAKFVDSLRRRGYIEIKKDDKNRSIKFTNKTKLALLRELSARSDFDGLNHFISFDIPERMRKDRDAFRRMIKRLGFRQIQKSLWVCKHDVGDLIEIAAYECGVEKYIAYIISKKSDIDGIIEKMFSK